MNEIKKVLFSAIVLAFACTPSVAGDKPEWVELLPDIKGDPDSGRMKAGTCDACHGEEGFSKHNYFPSLAGQKEEYLLFQLHYYRSSKRFHPLMTPATQDLTDTDIADLSAFYASIKITKSVEKVNPQ